MISYVYKGSRTFHSIVSGIWDCELKPTFTVKPKETNYSIRQWRKSDTKLFSWRETMAETSWLKDKTSSAIQGGVSLAFRRDGRVESIYDTRGRDVGISVRSKLTGSCWWISHFNVTSRFTPLYLLGTKWQVTFHH